LAWVAYQGGLPAQRTELISLDAESNSMMHPTLLLLCKTANKVC